MTRSRMRVERFTLEESPPAADAVVVIDVLRSFTTAAYAFAAGARAIYPVESVEHAQALRSRMPEAVTVGAHGGGAPIAEFDFGNSPSAIAPRALSGRSVIHFTAGGVKGLMRNRDAPILLAGSLTGARATARLLRRLMPQRVALVVTGNWIDRDGDEDHAFADYLEALLSGGAPDPSAFEARVRNSDFGRRFGDPAYPALPAEDLDCCARADCFDFALRVRRENGGLTMEAVN